MRCDRVYDETAARDGYVSLEVSPLLAFDTAGTLDEARRLWRQVGRENLMIKVPATPQGIPAIQQLIAEGINVNVTLLFSQDAYEQVAQAYMAGLEQFASAGGDVSRVASVASFFISRIDTAIEALVTAAPRGQAERARAGLAAFARRPRRDRQRQADLSSGIRRSLPGRAGRRSAAVARRRSACSGRAPAPRTPPTATSCMSKSSSARTRSTRCLRPRSMRFATTDGRGPACWKTSMPHATR